jgi:DNA (cytosine-5)-methyltransferase 1
LSLRIGSLFSGYGGLDLAVEQVTGATVAWHCEWESAPSAILAHHWPGVPNFHDVSKVDWASVEPVDILTGGFPCQDVSLAGRRRGLAEGTRSGLWSSFAEAISAIRPSLVCIENVRGLLSGRADSGLGFPDELLEYANGRPLLNAAGAVLGELASLGYDAEWATVRASEAGALHRRERVFILAYPRGERDGWRANAPSRREIGGKQSSSKVAAFSGERVAIPETWDRRAVERWERIVGWSCPASVIGKDVNPVFYEWMMGLEEGHITSPTIGLSRNDQLKACGNGVVPQQAVLALTELLGGIT